LTENHVYTDSNAKAEALNNYFQSVFTKEDQTNIPSLDSNTEDSIPDIPDIAFSVEGICQLLSELDTNKASGPDEIPPFVLKHCAEEILPVLNVIFTKSLSSGTLPSDCKIQYSRKEGGIMLLITGLYPLHPFVPRQWSILYSIIL